MVFFKLGITHEAIVFCLFFYGLMPCFVNLEVLILPNRLVLPLLWSGLIYNSFLFNPIDYILGAGAAYCVIWGLCKPYLSGTGREFVGKGDLKCFAMTGAWFGYRSLPVIFGSWLTAGVFLGVALVSLRRSTGSCPSGPLHLIAALAAFLSTSTLP